MIANYNKPRKYKQNQNEGILIINRILRTYLLKGMKSFEILQFFCEFVTLLIQNHNIKVV